MSPELSESHEEKHDPRHPAQDDPSRPSGNVADLEQHKRSKRLGSQRPMASRIQDPQTVDDFDLENDPTEPLDAEMVEQVRQSVGDVIDDDEPVQVAEPTSTHHDPRARALRFGLIAVALGLIGTSLLMGERDEQIDITAPTALTESSENGVIVHQAEDNAQVTEPGQLARDLIAATQLNDQGDGDLVTIVSEAGKLAEAGAQQDAYLLHFFAARQGAGKSAMYLAQLSDPLSFDVNNGVVSQPAPSDAYRWYRAAEDAGIADATERLAMLQDWARTEAGRGNEQAQRLLLQWR